MATKDLAAAMAFDGSEDFDWLLLRNGQQSLRICTRDGEQGSSRTARLFPTLLPALQRADRHPKQCGKLRLG